MAVEMTVEVVVARMTDVHVFLIIYVAYQKINQQRSYNIEYGKSNT